MAVEFAAIDFVVLGALLLVSILVGIFYAIQERRHPADQTASNYLMGDRKLPFIPVVLSLLVSFQSAILVLGTSSEMYIRGTTYWWSIVGIAISAILCCYLFVPVFYNLKLISVYEYLELRFGSLLIRRVGALLYITVIYLSLAMYAPSIALTGVTDVLPLWLLIMLAGVVCTFYVVIGGMKAVIWTDAIQAVVMLAAMIVIAVVGTIKAGGIEHVWTVGRERGRIIYYDTRLDPTLYMTSTYMLVSEVFAWLGWYGINQSSVQRYCGMPSARRGQLALLSNIPALFFIVSLVCYTGLVMFAYYATCDPLTSGQVADRDQLLPFFVMDVMSSIPGLSGLFVACLYSGTLSTVSSGLNSLAAVVFEDFLYTNTPEEHRNTSSLLTKGLCEFYRLFAESLAFGVVCTGLAYLGPYLGGVLQAAMALMGALNGPLTGIFLLGVLVPWANKIGVFVGVVVSSIVTVGLCLGYMLLSPHSAMLPVDTSTCSDVIPGFNQTLLGAIKAEPEPLSGFYAVFGLSYVLYDVIGVLLVFLVGIPVSWATGFQDVNEMDPRLYHPLFKMYMKSKSKSKPNKVYDVRSYDNGSDTKGDIPMTVKKIHRNN